MKRLLLSACLFMVACGNDSPTSPGGGGMVTPAPTLLSLNGIVTSGGIGLAGATVTIADGVNAGQGRVTDAAGNYSFTNLTPSAFTLQATAAGYIPQNRAVNLTTTSQTVSFALVKPNPIFQLSGTGDSVFTIPSYVSRIRIQGSYGGFCQNFIVRIAGSLRVNVILGTCSIADGVSHDGTYLTSGGTVEITNASGVAWIFTEVR